MLEGDLDRLVVCRLGSELADILLASKDILIVLQCSHLDLILEIGSAILGKRIALPGIHEVICRDCIPIAPLGAVTDVEPVGHLVIRYLIGIAEAIDRLVLYVLHEEAFAAVRDDAHRDCVSGDDGIERYHRSRDGDVHGLLLLGRRLLAALAASAAGEAGTHEDQASCRACLDKVTPAHCRNAKLEVHRKLLCSACAEKYGDGATLEGEFLRVAPVTARIGPRDIWHAGVRKLRGPYRYAKHARPHI